MLTMDAPRHRATGLSAATLVDDGAPASDRTSVRDSTSVSDSVSASDEASARVPALVSDPLLGMTVRTAATAATPTLHAFLTHLTRIGFDGAPRSFGVDEHGRHVLEHVPGRSADAARPLTLARLTRLGALVRDLHDAAESFLPPVGAVWDLDDPSGDQVVCHHGLAPTALVLGTERWVLVGWDSAGPGSRLDDLAPLVDGFVRFRADGDPQEDGARLRALVDGYGLPAHQRPDLVQRTAERVRARADAVWDGDAASWARTADYVERHRADLRAALR